MTQSEATQIAFLHFCLLQIIKNEVFVAGKGGGGGDRGGLNKEGTGYQYYCYINYILSTLV